MLKKRFDNPQNLVRDLAEELNCDVYMADLLYSRGIKNSRQANMYLFPRLEYLTNPLLYTGMKEAVDRIRVAIESHQKVVIFGDYDCDGVCGVAILWQALIEHGVDCDYFLPNRHIDGYGLSVNALENIAEEKYPDLIISVDCGISCREEVRYAQEELGIDVIVTDHHEPPAEIPECVVVDPKLDIDKGYFSQYCGAGVAFMLITALWGIDYSYKFIDIASIATIGDLVPLEGDNRIIASLGINLLNKKPRRGLKLLLDNLNVTGLIKSYDVSFKIVPRINSLGRMGDATRAMLLFSSTDDFILQCTIDEMNKENTNRQSECELVVKEATKKLGDIDITKRKSIVLYSENWNEGVLGIAAAKIAETYHRPTILLTDSDDSIKGSARSIEKIDLYKALSEVNEYFISYGGHKQAAGVRLKKENLDDFVNAFDTYMQSLDEDAFVKNYYYDLDMTGVKVDIAFLDELSKLEPFGMGNPKPTYILRSNDLNFEYLKNPQHLKAKSSLGYSVFAFNKGDEYEIFNDNVEKTYLVDLGVSEYNNRLYPQAIVNHVYISHPLSNVVEEECLFSYISKYIIPGKTANIKEIEYQEDFYNLTKEMLDASIYGTIFVTFSVYTYKKFVEYFSANFVDYKLEHYYKKIPNNIYNAIILAPQDNVDFNGYKNIIFLDEISEGYTSIYKKSNLILFKKFSNGLNVVPSVNRQDMIDAFTRIKNILQKEDINSCYHAIKVIKNANFENFDTIQLIFAWYVFEQLGIIDIGANNKYCITSVRSTLDKSKLYNNVIDNGIIR